MSTMTQSQDNFNPNLFNGPIPGEGMTKPLGGAPYQQPPQFVHLDDLLESLWQKINNPQEGVKIYGLLKAGLPAEAIGRTLLFGAFTHGVCTPTLALLALPTVVKQLVALGHMLGLKNIKIKNPNPEQTKALAKIAQVLNDSDPVTSGEQIQSTTGAPKNLSIFTGLGA